jgi:molybdopterin synthase catalytic subunit
MEKLVMRVTVLFFGMLKDLVGRSQEDLELPEGARLETVFEHYASQFPKLREMAGSVVIARNQEFADPEIAVADGDEVALMPPVSGGSDAASPWVAASEAANAFYALTRQPIDTRALAARLLQGEDGAVITFEGVVRNHSGGSRTLYLDYECYIPLALKKMREIGAEILGTHAVRGIAMVHRLGRLQIGETSVAIVVTAAHRKPAYEASLEAINRLKRLVPVWKKEYFEDGEVWVEGEWESSVPRPAGTPQ